jgi:uncharacterized membrane protein (DUF2068 family)
VTLSASSQSTSVSPPAVKHPAATLRTIALLEAAKGSLVILAGLVLFLAPHAQRAGVWGELVSHLHLNPAKHHPRVITALVGQAATHSRVLAAGALVYSAGRFAEAVGLWFAQPWAVWVAVCSASVYVPFEVAELLRRPSWLAAAALGVNAAVVAALVYGLPQYAHLKSGRVSGRR